MDSDLIVAFIQHEWLLLIALVVILIMLFQSHFADRMAGYTSASPEQAVRLLNDGALVLDVRSVDEFRGGYINGAKNINVTELGKKIDSLQEHKAGPTLVYCESGMRSARACALLKKAGFEQLYNLSGGIATWRAANLPVAKTGKKK